MLLRPHESRGFKGTEGFSVGTRRWDVLISGCGPFGWSCTGALPLLMWGCALWSALGSRFVAVREVAVGEPPVVLVVSQLPGLVGIDRLRDPFVELREGMRS